MTKIPVVKIHFDRKKKSSASKTGNVDIELYFDRNRRWISTGVKVLPKYWKEKSEMVVGHIDALDMNTMIENTRNKIKGVIRQIMMEGNTFTWDEYDALMSDPLGVRDSFIKFVEKRVNERLDIVESTRKNHRKFLKALKEFGQIRTFGNISKVNIMKYDEWLRKRRDYTQSTIHAYHKCMKVYINEALRLEHITYNPYDAIKIDRGKTKLRRYLTKEEVCKLEQAVLPTESLTKVRDLFLFQCYTGLAYADLFNFDFRKVTERNGKYVLYDRRVKSEEDYYIVILPKAMEILKTYDYVLPTLSNVQYNLRLKAVADIAGVDKAITSHMGRHTFATLSLNSGVPIEVLARMLGHSDIATTQIYAKLVNKTVEAAYDILEDKL